MDVIRCEIKNPVVNIHAAAKLALMSSAEQINLIDDEVVEVSSERLKSACSRQILDNLTVHFAVFISLPKPIERVCRLAMIQSVGDVLITGTYNKRAKDEYRLSNLFRWITVGLFSIGITIVISNFLIHLRHWWIGDDYVESSWALVTRLLTALVVALPAIYTARESARHRTNGDQATQRELELSTLGPFIELMPVDGKNAIRDRLTDRYFGNPIEPHKIESPLDSESISKIAEAVSKLIKPL